MVENIVTCYVQKLKVWKVRVKDHFIAGFRCADQYVGDPTIPGQRCIPEPDNLGCNKDGTDEETRDYCKCKVCVILFTL